MLRLTIIFCLSVNALIGQDSLYVKYHQLINKARYTHGSRLDSSIYYYNKAFDLATPFADDAYNLAIKYFKNNDERQAKKMLKKAVELGYTYLPDEELFAEYKSSLNPDIPYSGLPLLLEFDFNVSIKAFFDKKYQKLRTRYLRKIKSDKSCYYEDLLNNEKYYQDNRTVVYDKIKDSTWDVLHQYTKYMGSANSYFFLTLLENSELPERRKTRRFNSHSIMMLGLHCIAGFITKEDAEHFLTLLKPYVFIGEITPYEYATFYDQYIRFFVDEQKQYYGTFSYRDENNEQVFYEFIDYETLNQRRNEIGLPAMEQLSKSRKIKLPLKK